LFIVKELVLLPFVEAPFLKRLILKQNPRVSFPSRHQLMNHILATCKLKKPIRNLFEFLEACDTCMVSFDLWM
jgi:hypothetical protein